MLGLGRGLVGRGLGGAGHGLAQGLFDVVLHLGHQHGRVGWGVLGAGAGLWAQAFAHHGQHGQAARTGVLIIGLARWPFGNLARCALKAEIQQFCHLCVARVRGPPPKHGGDDAFAIALGRGDQVKPRGAGVAGFDAIGAFVGGQQFAIGIVDSAHARIGLAAGKQVVILREIVKQLAAQNGHVAGSGQMPAFGKAAHVFEMRPRHAHGLGRAVHAAGKGRF